MLLIIVYETGDLTGWSRNAWRTVAIPTSAWTQVYLWIAMYRVYRQGFFATSFKYFLLFIAYVSGLGISLAGVVLYTAMTL